MKNLQTLTVGFSKLFTLEFRTIFGNWQVGGEIANYVSKFRINFRTSIWNSFRVYQANMSEKKTASDELLKWMDSFRAQLDVGESTMIYKTLKDNKFKTRMQLKLIKGSELEIMRNCAVSFSAQALLEYQINFLNKQSPLPNKSIQNPNKKTHTVCG